MKEGLDELIALCRQRPGLVVAPSCTMRYFPGPRKVLALLRQMAVGRPLTFTYHRQWLDEHLEGFNRAPVVKPVIWKFH